MMVLPFWIVIVFAMTQGGMELRPIPKPRLDELEDTVREQVHALQELLSELESRDGVRPAELGEAFGEGGQLYFTYDLPEAAEACFYNARLLTPSDFRWPYYLGALAQKDGRLEEAASFYRETLKLRRDDVPTLLRLGEVHVQAGRTREAAERFGQVLAIDPGHAAARAGLGQVALLRRDFAGAVESFEAALDAVPEANRLHYPLAMALSFIKTRPPM